MQIAHKLRKNFITINNMKNTNFYKREKNPIESVFGSIINSFNKQWKGGRLKKRLNAHASLNGQLIQSYTNVLDFLKASWLSPVIITQRFPRGKETELICLSLLIDNNLRIRRRK